VPELPEVEVTRLSFADRIEGAKVRAVRLGKPLRWPLGVAPGALVGRTVGATTRRGKYLWLPLVRDGEGDGGGLLLHLGMSGSLAFSSVERAQPGPHDHFDLVTSAGTLTLTDPRRFGAVVWARAREDGLAGKLLSGLGMEPFDPAFTGDALWRAFRRRTTSVKAALLAGDIVVGAGNIYACEALHLARIDPRTRADRISLTRCERLAGALRETLASALEYGGSTLRDFRDAGGAAGEFQLHTRVYGREGAPCPTCGAAVRRVLQGQRSTFLCTRCQRR
jgi:formamidopyrimidine-DNA glycosylase